MGSRQNRNRLKSLVTAFFCGFLSFSPSLGEVFSVNDLGCGVQDTVPGNLIADCAVKEAVNVYVDKHSRGLVQREGSSRLNSTQLTGKKAVDVFTYVQDDGDEFLLAFSSQSWYYSTDNGSTFTTLITTATDGSTPDGVSFLNGFYWVSQNDGGNVCFGSSHTAVGAMPSASFIEKYENRLWVANTVANNNRLFFSGLLQPTTWTTSTDYIDLPEPISGLGKPFDGGLPIYTENQTWILRGNDPTNFYLQEISDVIGCINNRSIQNFSLLNNQVQLFFSKGINMSENNIYALTGNSVIPVGNRVLNTLSAVNSGNISLRNKVWDTQADFDAGTYTQVTSTLTVGSIRLYDYRMIDDFDDDSYQPEWTTFDVNDTTVTALNDRVEISTGNLVAHRGGLYRTSTIISSTGVFRFTTNAKSADRIAFKWTLIAPTDNNLTSPENETAKGYMFMIKMSSDSGISKQTFYRLNGSSVTLLGTASGGSCEYSFDQNYTWYIQRDKVGFWTIQGLLCSTYPTDTTYSSMTYVSFGAHELSTNTTTSPNTRIDTVEFQPTEGEYISDEFQADSDIARWGNFEADYSYTVPAHAGTIFFVRTATGSTALSNTAWTAIAPGTQISTTTNRFFQWRGVFDQSTTGGPIIINKVTANYTSSISNSQPLATSVFEGNYWLSYTGGSESRNQSVIVMNGEGAFVGPMDGLNAYSMTVENGRLFAGDSATDTVNGGYAWEYETGNTDNGTPVSAQVTFKDNGFPGLEDYEKSLISVYFNYAVTVGTFTATIIENFNENSSTYTVRFATGTLYNRWKLEPNQQTTAKYISLRLNNDYSGSLLKLYPPITYHFEKVRLIPP